MVLEQLNMQAKNTKLILNLTLYTKIHSKMEKIFKM